MSVDDEARIRAVINDLCSGEDQRLKRTITNSFHPNARLVHPLVRVEGREQIRQLYRAMELFFDPQPIVHKVYFSKDGDALVDMTQTVAARVFPFFRVPLPVEIIIRTAEYEGRRVVVEQYDHVSMYAVFWWNPLLRVLHERVYLPLTGVVLGTVFPLLSTILDGVVGVVPDSSKEVASGVHKHVDEASRWLKKDFATETYVTTGKKRI